MRHRISDQRSGKPAYCAHASSATATRTLEKHAVETSGAKERPPEEPMRHRISNQRSGKPAYCAHSERPW
ncbi:hypothetical protein NDU88_003921 [Pleurodeles waltl]|uniref:Uncharacterized protein n=1 Tax=Pleurodeles waltl TaxID=8319 RepID=A0AAV7KWA7_PLEWA|nr:hypothetical protein NDU88_003921 [Pleurodeles waltl]